MLGSRQGFVEAKATLGWKEKIGALLGISAYELPKGQGPSLSSGFVEKIRERFGGQLSPLPATKTRWYLRDLEAAIHSADAGNLSQAAKLYHSFRRDGTIAGLLATRTSGLVRLPKRFRGDAEIKRALEASDGLNARSLFDDIHPSAELALLAADGIALGVGLAERVPVKNRRYPVLVRHNPEFLRYRWNENRWYFASVAGEIAVTPGDGRWVLHVPGGRMAPWQHGLWSALGMSWINKTHAIMHRSNFSAKLANPARVAQSPSGATEAQREGMLQQLIAWGVNSVFELPPGWEAKILESNGRGYDVFQAEINTCDREAMIALAGQEVTTTGGTGFANADIHKSIRADLIKETADALAYTVNTQCIPQFIVEQWGEAKLLEGGAVVEWEVDPPKDVKLEAEALKAFGEALASLRNGLLPYRRDVDIASLANRFGVPIAQDSDGDGNPDADGAEQEQPSTLDEPPTGEDGEARDPVLQ
jgi:phage gp29-like protein